MINYKIKNLKEKIILILICLILISIPLIFWGSSYNLGGDDGKLYYILPYEYFKNFTLKNISDNVIGSLGLYFSQSYISIFALLLTTISFIFKNFINIENFCFGLNLAFGFLFFYKLLGLFIKNEKKYDFLIKITSGLFYIFSTFSIITIWISQLFSIYLISIFPAIIFLFLKSIYENKIKYTILSSLLFSIFSITIFSIPWLIALTISVLPLLIFSFLKNKKIFLRSLLCFGILLILLNFYWVFHFIYSPITSDNISQNNVISNTNSKDFRKENEINILAVSSNNQLIYPLFNLFHKNIQKDFNWQSYKIYKNWHEHFFIFNSIFLLLIILPFFYYKKYNNQKIKNIHTISFISFLIIIFLFTVNIGGWGTNLFLFLNNHIPGFTMFRNMFDKFGMAMAFSYAFMLAFSLKILFDNIKHNVIKNIIIIYSITITVLNSKPFILGEYYNKPIWTTKETYNTLNDFNSDYYNLVDFIKNIDTSSRFMWIPFNNANYTQISDKNLKNHYYSGVSPLQILSNKQDFNGVLSFGINGEEIRKLLILGDYKNIAEFIRKMNTEYIILNNDISKDLQSSYLYSYLEPGDIYNLQQDKKYLNELLGDKIKDFGRYSLYKINSKYENKKIYLSNNVDKFPDNYNQLEYSKIYSYKYSINIKNLKEKSNLVFLDPYHKLWEIYSKKDNKPIITGSHKLVYDYANGWEIDPEYIKKNFDKSYYKENPDGSIDIELTLYFKPQSYFYLGLIISGTTLIGCVTYLIINGIKNIKKE